MSDPANANGVLVLLDIFDRNGNLIHIGKTTDSLNCNYGFGY